MKQEGIRPNSVTYKHLLRAFADEKMHPEAWAVLKDMQAMGIEPDQEAYNIVLSVSSSLVHMTIMNSSDTGPQRGTFKQAVCAIRPDERTWHG